MQIVLCSDFFVSHIQETDGQFAQIARGKRIRDIASPERLEQFLHECYESPPELVENGFIVFDWKKFLDPYGPKKLEQHSKPLEFQIKYVKDQGAVLYHRAVVAGELKWQGDTRDKPVRILSSVPPGEPGIFPPRFQTELEIEIIERVQYTQNQVKAMVSKFSLYLRDPNNVKEWERWFKKLESPPERYSPFALSMRSSPKEWDGEIPHTLVPREYNSYYDEFKKDPLKLHATYHDSYPEQNTTHSEEEVRFHFFTYF